MWFFSRVSKIFNEFANLNLKISSRATHKVMLTNSLQNFIYTKRKSINKLLNTILNLDYMLGRQYKNVWPRVAHPFF